MTLNAERVTFTKKKKTVACPVPLAPLADTHAHLLSFWGKDVPETLLRAKAAGVDLLVTALIFGQKLRDGQPRRLGDQTARCRRRRKPSSRRSQSRNARRTRPCPSPCRHPGH